MTLRFSDVCVDAHDIHALSSWWSTVLGWPAEATDDGDVALRAPDGAGPDWLFLAVPDDKVVKNRIHFDFTNSTTPSGTPAIRVAIASKSCRTPSSYEVTVCEWHDRRGTPKTRRGTLIAYRHGGGVPMSRTNRPMHFMDNSGYP